MKVSHKAAILESPAIDGMCKYLEERSAKWASNEGIPDLETFEKGLHECLMELERELVAEELSRYDVVAERIEVEGVVYHHVLSSSTTYQCGAGEVRVERQLYREGGRGKKSICPLEMQSGIVMGLMTPRAARQSAFLMAHLPAETAEELLAEIGNLTPSRSTLGKVPTALSRVWEPHREAWEREIRKAEVVPEAAAILVVSQDGVMTPMKEGERTKKRTQAEKQPSGPAGYKEVGCGTVSLYDAEGVRLQTVKYGRMPEKNKATLHRQLEAECQSILPKRPDLTVVKLADGAKDNWQSLGSLEFALEQDVPAPHQVEIVDFFHAADHLSDACNAIWGKAQVKTKAEFERLRILLKEHEQGSAKVINVLRYHMGRVKTPSRKDVIRKQLTYFRNQRRRMRYADYLAQGLPIASGVVEATCKTLVTQRMKCSGMAWKQTGGQAILTLRSLIQSDRWLHAWLLLKDTFCTPVTICA
jgi:hypothetical protein